MDRIYKINKIKTNTGAIDGEGFVFGLIL